MSATESPEALFRQVFLPLYPEDAKGDLGRARAEDANPSGNPTLIRAIDEAAEVFVGMAEGALGRAVSLDYTDASVHRLSAALDAKSLVTRGAVGSDDNLLFNVVVHGALYVGACVVRNHGAHWAVRRPLWESLVRLRSHAGDAELPIFHWFLKSLADNRTATLADRYRTHVEVPTARPEDLPVLAPPDRRLPKLTQVRYDTLHKYLRAHLPELRDLGAGFPSPERFAEYRFAHLTFTLVGGGRMLLMAGATAHGLHAFWLTREGFDKAAFWPADAFPAPMIRPRGDGKLEVLLSHEGKARTFEILWWGP